VNKQGLCKHVCWQCTLEVLRETLGEKAKVKVGYRKLDAMATVLLRWSKVTGRNVGGCGVWDAFNELWKGGKVRCKLDTIHHYTTVPFRVRMPPQCVYQVPVWTVAKIDADPPEWCRCRSRQMEGRFEFPHPTVCAACYERKGEQFYHGKFYKSFMCRLPSIRPLPSMYSHRAYWEWEDGIPQRCPYAEEHIAANRADCSDTILYRDISLCKRCDNYRYFTASNYQRRRYCRIGDDLSELGKAVDAGHGVDYRHRLMPEGCKFAVEHIVKRTAQRGKRK